AKVPERECRLRIARPYLSSGAGEDCARLIAANTIPAVIHPRNRNVQISCAGFIEASFYMACWSAWTLRLPPAQGPPREEYPPLACRIPSCMQRSRDSSYHSLLVCSAVNRGLPGGNLLRK